MPPEQPTRVVVKMLRKAGWVSVRTAGSHSVWKCPGGETQFSLPDGHKQISFGVYTKLLDKMKECTCE